MNITNSMIGTFLSCRRKCRYAYIDKLKPKRDESHPLYFGRLLHEMLEKYHLNQDVRPVINSAENDQDKAWLEAMHLHYSNRYGNTRSVIGAERVFESKIVHPGTGDTHTLGITGKLDLEVEVGGEHWLMEHKTVSSGFFSGGYIDRLADDRQIGIYLVYNDLDGIIYDIIQKPTIKLSRGETVAEYKQRKEALSAKNKSGKSSAKRRMPESKAEYVERLMGWYNETEMSMWREEVYLDDEQTRDLMIDVWGYATDIERCIDSGVWYRNTDNCFKFSRPCEFMPLCQGGDSQALVDIYYTKKGKQHEEL